MLAEKGEHLDPAIHCLLGPVEWQGAIEDAVGSTIVAVELVHLAVLLELALVLVHLFRARRAVVVAEYAEQRATEVRRHFDRRDGRLGIELLLAHHHAAAPEVDACVDVFPLAGIDEGVPTTRTGAENADLAIVIGLRAYPLHCGLGIADHLGVGNAAVGDAFGGEVVRVALSRTLVEVSADRDIAVMREPTRRLNVELAPVYALGCLICSQLDLLVELALEGMQNALPRLLFRRHYRALQHRPAELGP